MGRLYDNIGQLSVSQASLHAVDENLFGPAGTPWNPSDRPHTHHLRLSLPRKYRPGAALGEMLASELRVGAGAATVE